MTTLLASVCPLNDCPYKNKEKRDPEDKGETPTPPTWEMPDLWEGCDEPGP